MPNKPTSSELITGAKKALELLSWARALDDGLFFDIKAKMSKGESPFEVVHRLWRQYTKFRILAQEFAEEYDRLAPWWTLTNKAQYLTQRSHFEWVAEWAVWLLAVDEVARKYKTPAIILVACEMSNEKLSAVFPRIRKEGLHWKKRYSKIDAANTAAIEKGLRPRMVFDDIEAPEAEFEAEAEDIASAGSMSRREDCATFDDLLKRAIKQVRNDFDSLSGPRRASVSTKPLGFKDPWDGVTGHIPVEELQPHWDPATRVLTFNREVIFKYRKQAPIPQRILDAFQKAGWPPELELESVGIEVTKREVNNILTSLKRKLEEKSPTPPIRFQGNGLGTGIGWRVSSDTSK